MKIEFGIWDHFEQLPDRRPEQQYQEKIQLLREAERLGVYAYHLAEHHLSPLDLAPSPNIFLAALAQATKKIRIGTMVHILPLYHPARLVQEFVMLDNLSGGRFQFGLGKGTRAVEHEWFGLRPSEAAARNEEMLQIVVSALSTGNMAFDGQFYTIPDAPLTYMTIQRPYPPIWYAGTPEFPGRRNLNFLTRAIGPLIRYWDLWNEHHDGETWLNPSTAVPLVGITKHMVVRHDRAEAMAIGARAWPAFNAHWNATSLAMPDGKTPPKTNSDFEASVAENARLLVGTPESVLDYLREFLTKLGDRPSFYFAPAIQWGNISTDEAFTTLKILTEEVFPVIRREFGAVMSRTHAVAV